MRAETVAGVIESVAPLFLQEDYDNSGFICGDREKEISGVLVCLDVNKEAINAALSRGCDMIVSHHPLIFRGVKSIMADDARSRAILALVKHDITAYAAHTNIDKAAGGLNDEFARLCGVAEPFPLEGGEVVCGGLEKSFTLESLAERISQKCATAARTAGYPQKKVMRAAVVNGAGGRDESVIDAVIKSGADVFVSSELKYSNVLRLVGEGIGVIEIGHYNSERHFIGFVAQLLKDNLNGLRVEEFYFDPYNEGA